MALFTLTCRDKPESFELRAANRPAHLEWLAGHADKVRLGGPWLDGEGRGVGSLLIVEFDSRAAAEAWAAQDPYARAGLFASVAVEPWRLVVGGFAEAA